MSNKSSLESFDEIVDAWKEYSRRDCVARFDLVVRMRNYVRRFSNETARLAVAIGKDLHTMQVYLRVASRFDRSEVLQLAAKGYGWSHLVLMANKNETAAQQYKAMALSVDTHPRVMKAQLNTRPIASQSRFESPRDKFIVALGYASPTQVGNWLTKYVLESCAPARAEAFRDELAKALDTIRLTLQKK